MGALVPSLYEPARPHRWRAGVVAWTCWKLRRLRRSIKNLKLGRDGERAVAEVLDGLRELGYRVFHDIVAPSFNLDHVLVGPKGVFLIETKTHSKPVGREARVEYDGREVFVGGFKPNRDPVQQAERSARWLADLLEQMTGRQCSVRPVVLYPGWYVDDTARKNRGQTLVWVLNPGNLAGFINREPVRFSSEDVSAVTFHLARYVRAASVGSWATRRRARRKQARWSASGSPPLLRRLLTWRMKP